MSAYNPPDNNAFSVDFTIGYESPANDEFNASFCLYEYPSDTEFDFNFEDGYDPPANDEFDFNFVCGSAPPEIPSLTDLYSFNDSISVSVKRPLSLSDSYSYNDASITNLIISFSVLDSYMYHDLPHTKDFVVSWRCRTKTARLGFGGTQYGNVIGYGDGYAFDIDRYIIQVKNSSGDVLRTEEITITDKTNPDGEYWYTFDMNVTDNGSWTDELTFEVRQIDVNGVYSEIESISTF